MKTVLSLAIVLSLMSSSAFAINHKHAHKLEQAGCTQVQEANGECPQLNVKHAKAAGKHLTKQDDAAAAAREWDRLHSQPQRSCADLPVDATNAERRDCID